MKKLLAATIAVVLLLMAAGCQTGEKPPAPDETVATLDDYTVPYADCAFYFYAYKNNIETQALGNGYTEETLSDYWKEDQGQGTRLQSLIDYALEMAKQYHVLYQAAVSVGVQVSEDAKAKSESQVNDMLEEQGGDEAAFLDRHGVSPAEMKRIYNQFDAVEQFQTDLLDSLQISPEELDAAYQRDKDAYAQVKVRHVLILANDSMTAAEQNAAKQKAEDILAQLEEGADIGELAAEYSEDPGSKDKNGEYTFGKGEMVEEFESWSFSAQPGDLGIVRTSYGYHVMQKIESLPADPEVVKPQIEEALVYEKVNEKLFTIMAPADSADWVINQEPLDRLAASIAS